MSGNESAVFFELKRYFSVAVCFNACQSRRIEIVPHIVYHDPTAGENSEFGISPLAVGLYKTRINAAANAFGKGVIYAVLKYVSGESHAVDILSAVRPDAVEKISAFGAFQNAVNESVGMPRCGYGRAPVNNGVADFAERSSRVACFRAGRSLVRKSNGCMLMPRSNIESSALVALVNTDIAVGAHRFAVYLDLCGRECSERTVFKYDTSRFCQKLNIHRIYAFLLRYNPVGIFAESVMRIPCANGNGSNNSFSSIGNSRCFS